MIELTREGAVARLTLRRAEKKNAMTESMWRTLLHRCQALDAECRVAAPGAPRVLWLQGQPGVFCAGADIEEMTLLVRHTAALESNNHVVAQAQLALERLPIPTLALIDGPCFGGGFGLAAACDVRLASGESRFAITPARLGLVYSLEDTRRVVALAGPNRAKRLLLLSEEIDAATALAWGVLDAVVPAAALQAEARRWSERLVGQSRTSLAGIKATLGHITGNGAHDEAEVRALHALAFAGPDFAEGSAAFLQRRAPSFR